MRWMCSRMSVVSVAVPTEGCVDEHMERDGEVCVHPPLQRRLNVSIANAYACQTREMNICKQECCRLTSWTRQNRTQVHCVQCLVWRDFHPLCHATISALESIFQKPLTKIIAVLAGGVGESRACVPRRSAKKHQHCTCPATRDFSRTFHKPHASHVFWHSVLERFHCASVAVFHLSTSKNCMKIPIPPAIWLPSPGPRPPTCHALRPGFLFSTFRCFQVYDVFVVVVVTVVVVVGVGVGVIVVVGVVDFVVVVDVDVVVDDKIRCLCWLRSLPRRSVAAAPALELPRVLPARVVRKTRRLQEKRFSSTQTNCVRPKPKSDLRLVSRVQARTGCTIHKSGTQKTARCDIRPHSARPLIHPRREVTSTPRTGVVNATAIFPFWLCHELGEIIPVMERCPLLEAATEATEAAARRKTLAG